MIPATRHLFRKSVTIGLVIELCMLSLFFLPRLTGSDEPKPLAEAFVFAFHLPVIFPLSLMGFEMGSLVNLIPFALAGWLQCSLIVCFTELMNRFVSRKSPT